MFPFDGIDPENLPEGFEDVLASFSEALSQPANTITMTKDSAGTLYRAVQETLRIAESGQGDEGLAQRLLDVVLYLMDAVVDVVDDETFEVVGRIVSPLTPQFVWGPMAGPSPGRNGLGEGLSISLTPGGKSVSQPP